MTSPSRIVRLVGVYNADGTLRGELAYWVGSRLGRAHCALCDITHGRVRERADWKECREGLPVRFDMFHADDQPEPMRALLAGALPAVLAETSSGFTVLLDDGAVARCNASPQQLMDAISAAADRQGLTWT